MFSQNEPENSDALSVDIQTSCRQRFCRHKITNPPLTALIDGRISYSQNIFPYGLASPHPNRVDLTPTQLDLVTSEVAPNDTTFQKFDINLLKIPTIVFLLKG